MFFRARPLNLSEKERGDKNIIKLPENSNGAVWVSNMPLFLLRYLLGYCYINLIILEFLGYKYLLK